MMQYLVWLLWTVISPWFLELLKDALTKGWRRDKLACDQELDAFPRLCYVAIQSVRSPPKALLDANLLNVLESELDAFSKPQSVFEIEDLRRVLNRALLPMWRKLKKPRGVQREFHWQPSLCKVVWKSVWRSRDHSVHQDESQNAVNTQKQNWKEPKY